MYINNSGYLDLGQNLDKPVCLVSPNQNERPAGAVIDLVVIHGTCLPTRTYGSSCVVDLFMNRLERDLAEFPELTPIKDRKVSAHLYLDRTGHITQLVSFGRRAWHAGVSQFEGRENCNDFSIGIELEGTADSEYTEAQYQQLIRVLKVLCLHYPAITPERVVGHADVSPGRKIDPGPYFDWSRVRQAIQRDC